MRGVDDLRVELDSVEPPLGVLAGGDRRAGARCQRREAGGRLVDAVAVTHPALLRLGQPGEEAAALIDEGQLGPPELATFGPLDPAAERLDHRLHPVTDAEHRDPELEQLGAQRRRPLLVHGGGSTGEDERARVAEPDSLDVGVVWEQLGEDPALAEPAGDQLRVLAAEVEHEDLLAIDPDPARLAARRIDDGCVDRAFRRQRFGHLLSRRRRRRRWRLRSGRSSPSRRTGCAVAACPRSEAPARP